MAHLLTLYQLTTKTRYTLKDQKCDGVPLSKLYAHGRFTTVENDLEIRSSKLLQSICCRIDRTCSHDFALWRVREASAKSEVRRGVKFTSRKRIELRT